MATPRLGIIIPDERALDRGRPEDPVACVVLRSTLINPPRVAGASRLRARIAETHPEAAIVPYVWHLVSHGPGDGLREHGTRSLSGEPRAFGHLQGTTEVRQAWEITAQCAGALGAETVILRTPASFTPGALHRQRLAEFVAARRGEGYRVLWEAEGLWEAKTTLAIARELDCETLIPAFDGTGRAIRAKHGRLDRRWLRVDGAGPTTRLRPVLAEALLMALEGVEEAEEDEAAEVTILFGGPRGYANLRAFAEAQATF